MRGRRDIGRCSRGVAATRHFSASMELYGAYIGPEVFPSSLPQYPISSDPPPGFLRCWSSGLQRNAAIARRCTKDHYAFIPTRQIKNTFGRVYLKNGFANSTSGYSKPPLLLHALRVESRAGRPPWL